MKKIFMFLTLLVLTTMLSACSSKNHKIKIEIEYNYSLKESRDLRNNQTINANGNPIYLDVEADYIHITKESIKNISNYIKFKTAKIELYLQGELIEQKSINYISEDDIDYDREGFINKRTVCEFTIEEHFIILNSGEYEFKICFEILINGEEHSKEKSFTFKVL